MKRLKNENQNTKCETKSEIVRLEKHLDLSGAVALIVGSIVGSGIFVSPKGVLQEAGSMGMALVIWAASGILSMIGAICYAELGTMILESGCDYAYIKRAFGHLPAFLFLWVSVLIIIPANNAIAGLTFATYILQPLFPYCTPPESAIRIIAFLVISFLTFVNCVNVKWTTKVQVIFTLAKVFALMAIIAVGILELIFGDVKNYNDMFKGTITSPGHIALSFYSGLYSYGGWNAVNFVTEELKKPFKNLPRSILISMPIVTIIYLLTNLSYFVVLSSDGILTSNAVAVTFGEMTIGCMAWTMSLCVALSTFGCLNGTLFASSRLMFVGARYGHLPSILASVNIKYRTPITTLLFMCFTSSLYLLTTGVYTLINYTAFVTWFFVALSVAALLWLRVSKPEIKRPIKVNIAFPILFFFVCVFLVTFPFYLMTFEATLGALITLSGVPIYFLAIYCQKSSIKFFDQVLPSLSNCFQRLFFSDLTEKFD
ncbi:large neutral amino acids transporter small subunit 2-like protein [Dinothrombium tinctorium]|uniref:Large neutral amino acids transporter small subunit 2-like protein n=1 Tax=Dinothrombium tinctorium TaxID=1965070 RepID=A0A443R683_9ACAR|nr:large neutral amino acids transporter small subunit 2-like protein [Dinothrombium tinctorium]